MRICALFWSLGVSVISVAFAACGETTVIPGVDDSGALDAAPTSDGERGADAERPPMDAGADDADAAVGALTCSELVAAYGAALPDARICDPLSLLDECTVLRERRLGCGCDTFLNANRVATLDGIAAEWKSKGCTVGLCPAIACLAAESGKCDGANEPASCKDVLE